MEVAAAISPTETPVAAETAAPTTGTNAGSFGLFTYRLARVPHSKRLLCRMIQIN